VLPPPRAASGVHVSVRVGGEHYALPVEGVLEVIALGEITAVPGADPAVLGVSNLRGQIVAVVDLAAVLGLRAPHAPQRIVVAEDGGRRVGLAVESVSEVGFVGEPTEEVDVRFLRGATFVDGALVGIVAIGELLDALTAEPPP
jgi:purine-binding chemotaxis protein CheW